MKNNFLSYVRNNGTVSIIRIHASLKRKWMFDKFHESNFLGFSSHLKLSQTQETTEVISDDGIVGNMLTAVTISLF